MKMFQNQIKALELNNVKSLILCDMNFTSMHSQSPPVSPAASGGSVASPCRVSSRAKPCIPSLQKVLLHRADLDTRGFRDHCGEIAGVEKSGESCIPPPLAPALHRNWDPRTPLSVCPASQSKQQTQFNISSQMPTRGHSHTPENTAPGSRYISIQCRNRGTKCMESKDLDDRFRVNSAIPTCETVHNWGKFPFLVILDLSPIWIWWVCRKLKLK